MSYLYTFPNATTPDQILVQTGSTMSSLIPLFFVFVFGVIFLGGSRRQAARTGQTDYPMWALTASLATLLIAAMTTLVSGLVSLSWIVIVTVVTVFSGLWLFLDRKFYESNSY